MTRLPQRQKAMAFNTLSPAEETPDTYTVHTSQIFEPLSKTFIPNVSITVSRETGLITYVEHRSSPSISNTPLPSSHDLDLRHLPLILPGLTDAHTHIFLHAYSEAPSRTQELAESPVERILRASNHCRAALDAGFTTYRDLGTEGIGDADTHVRNAVNRGLIPGPRLFVATEPIASSGGYAVRTESDATASLGSPYGAGAGPFSLGLVTNRSRSRHHQSLRRLPQARPTVPGRTPRSQRPTHDNPLPALAPCRPQPQHPPLDTRRAQRNRLRSPRRRRPSSDARAVRTRRSYGGDRRRE